MDTEKNLKNSEDPEIYEKHIKKNLTKTEISIGIKRNVIFKPNTGVCYVQTRMDITKMYLIAETQCYITDVS